MRESRGEMEESVVKEWKVVLVRGVRGGGSETGG